MTDCESKNAVSRSDPGCPQNRSCGPASGQPGESNLSTAETTRRRFLKIGTALFSSFVAVILGIPMIGTVIDHISRKKPLQWSKVGRIGGLSVNQPTNISFPYRTRDAYIRETLMQSVWVIKHSASEITVFSPICPHLGCYFDWHPEKKEFTCPCHGSIYSVTGKVLGGPAPRPLDTLPHKLEGDQLLVEWKVFKVGIPEKVRV